MVMSDGGPLYRFLKGLHDDPAKLQAWRDDPEVAMTSAGLSEADKAVLRTRDRKQIEDALRARGLPPAAQMFIVP